MNCEGEGCDWLIQSWQWYFSLCGGQFRTGERSQWAGRKDGLIGYNVTLGVVRSLYGREKELIVLQRGEGLWEWRRSLLG